MCRWRRPGKADLCEVHIMYQSQPCTAQCSIPTHLSMSSQQLEASSKQEARTSFPETKLATPPKTLVPRSPESTTFLAKHHATLQTFCKASLANPYRLSHTTHVQPVSSRGQKVEKTKLTTKLPKTHSSKSITPRVCVTQIPKIVREPSRLAHPCMLKPTKTCRDHQTQ